MEQSIIKRLLAEFSPAELESCFIDQVETGTNTCIPEPEDQRSTLHLARAQAVIYLMKQGLSETEAFDTLERRIGQVDPRLGTQL